MVPSENEDLGARLRREYNDTSIIFLGFGRVLFCVLVPHPEVLGNQIQGKSLISIACTPVLSQSTDSTFNVLNKHYFRI